MARSGLSSTGNLSTGATVRPAVSRSGRRFLPSWPLAIAAFVIPFLLLVGSVIYRQMSAPSFVTFQVTDQYTGAPLAGALIARGDQQFQTDAAGQVRLIAGKDPVQLSVSHDGYAPVSGTVNLTGVTTWPVTLRPATLAGAVVDTESGQPIVGANVVAIGEDGTAGTPVQTDAQGRYLLSNVPPGATLRVESADYGSIDQAAANQTQLDVSMKKSIVTGIVADANGAPIAGARVAVVDGSADGVTGDDGTYKLTGVAEGKELLFSAPGYEAMRAPIAANGQVNATMQTEQIKALYASSAVIADQDHFNELVNLAKTTEINALVLDVKEEQIFYDTQVPFFRDVPNMVNPVYDPRELVAQLKAEGIYTIARMVVFKDPLVAEARQDLAVRVQGTGEVWRDDNGAAWVNAFYPELWQANADLAAELADIGFDEIQYDYVRFPSDGNLKIAEFGNDYREDQRRAAITSAVEMGAREVHEHGAAFSVDLFPIVALKGDDQGIGQTVQDLAPLVDFVSLMIYPSHYSEGNIPVDGHPNDFPSETVTYTLQKAEEMAPGTLKKMRPWLQDFTYPMPGFSEYGPKQVREQIDAAEAAGTSGWILWNAAGDFSNDALTPRQ